MSNRNGATPNSVKGAFSRFLKDQSGSVTQILGLAAIPMFLAAGAAVDTARINREHASFNMAVDSAVLAVAADDRSALTGLSDSQKAARIEELETFAKEYIEANYSAEQGTESSVTVELAINDQAIDITAHHQFPTTIMSMAGINTIELDAHARVQKAMRPIELVMVMDTTGSMGTTYMDQAKQAARTLMNRLYGGTKTEVPESEFIRVALVPFAAAVRLNTAAYDFKLDWIDTAGLNPLSKLNFTSSSWNNYYAWSRLKSSGSSYHTWNGCVESRMSSATPATDYLANDIAPNSAVGSSLFPAYFYPDDPTTSGSGYSGYSNGSWFNDYVGNYSPLSSTPPATGYETSGMGKSDSYKTSSSWTSRLKNQAKYDGKNIGAENMTYSGANKGPWLGCSKSKVVPMTYKRANVESGIDSMVAAGGTNIAEGLAWGWRVISPTEPFTKVEGSASYPATDIAPYGHPRWQKIMVLMTDGENDPYVRSGSSIVELSLSGSAYNSYGRGYEAIANNRYGTTSLNSLDDEINNDMSTICERIKDAGITLYTTAFRVSSPTVTGRLEDCATSPDHYSYAASGADLTAFFDHIGQDVLNKSIYVSK
jgi:Flp pilus assembly protein TadG